MSYDRLATRLYNTPLLIASDKIEVIENVFRAYLDGTAKELPKFQSFARPDILARTGTTFTRERAGYMRSDSGIAMIEVFGSLVQRTSGLDAMSGMESYTNIAAQLEAALHDPKVKGILLEIDSPGGEANGVAGLAAAIREANAEKPVVALANEHAFSAAYWLAASAGEMYVPKTGMVGSVGVIMLHVDQSRMNEKRGLEVTHITAGDKKADFSPHKALSDTALTDAQAMVDRLMENFVNDVAEARGIDPQVVKDTQAGLLHPDQAKERGMVDGIGDLNFALNRLGKLIADPTKSKSYGRAAANAHVPTILTEGDIMDPVAKPAAPNANAAITAEQLADARTAGIAEGKTAGAAEVTKAGADAERTRVSGILTHAEAAGRATLAQHLAFKTAMSVDDAGAMLAAAPKEAAAAAADPLATAMANVKNPKVGAGADEGEETEASVAARILAAGGFKPKLAAVK